MNDLLTMMDRAMKKSEMDDSQRSLLVEILETEARGRESIVFFAKEKLGIELNAFQTEWLTKTTTPRAQWKEKFGIDIDNIGGLTYGSNISSIGNQSGKTVATAIKHIWFNYYKIGMNLPGDMIDTAEYATLNLSPHSNQTQACFNYVETILSGNFIIDEEMPDGTRKKRLNDLHPSMKGFLTDSNVNLGKHGFKNGSTMYSRSSGHDQASSLAGVTYGYISYDECSQSLHLSEELGAKIMSRLIKYGCCLDLIATPEVDSPSHTYYLHIVRLGQKGKEGWWALTGMGMDDNRFISREQRERIKKSLMATDPVKYQQVVKGEFVSGGKRLFDPAEIDQMWQMDGRRNCIDGHKYLLSADWGMSDTGDKSVFLMFDYTEYASFGRIYLVNHEEVKGGAPQMQFAILRTLYEAYTHDYGGVRIPPLFVMDAEAMGGVMIKKLLHNLKPKAFDMDKDIALFETKRALSFNRDYEVSPVDGMITEKNPDFGMVRSYFIDEPNDQMGIYRIEDKKLETDFTMAFMMGISYIVKKLPRGNTPPVKISNLSSYQMNVHPVPTQRLTAMKVDFPGRGRRKY